MVVCNGIGIEVDYSRSCRDLAKPILNSSGLGRRWRVRMVDVYRWLNLTPSHPSDVRQSSTHPIRTRAAATDF